MHAVSCGARTALLALMASAASACDGTASIDATSIDATPPDPVRLSCDPAAPPEPTVPPLAVWRAEDEQCVLALGGGAPLEATLTHIAAPAVPRVTQPKWSPDGRKLAFAAEINFGETSLHLVTLASGSPVHAPMGLSTTYVQQIVWAPDSTKLVVASHPSDVADERPLRLVDVSSLPPRVSFVGGERAVMHAFSPDSRRMAFASDDELHVMDVGPCANGASLLVDRLAPASNLVALDDAKWSPDGATLYYLLRHADGTIHIHAADVSGPSPGPGQKLTNIPVALQASYAVDRAGFAIESSGRSLVYVGDSGEGTTQLLRLPVDGVDAGAAVALADDPSAFSASPVSDDVAYRSAEGTFVVRGDGTRMPVDGVGLDWSPDGRWLSSHDVIVAIGADGVGASATLATADSSGGLHARVRDYFAPDTSGRLVVTDEDQTPGLGEKLWWLPLADGLGSPVEIAALTDPVSPHDVVWRRDGSGFVYAVGGAPFWVALPGGEPSAPVRLTESFCAAQ